MDSTPIHLLLDRIREEQIQHGVMLQDMIDRHDDAMRILQGIYRHLRERASKPAKTWAIPWTGMIAGVQYLIMLGGLIYALRGGDIDKLAALAKALAPS